MRASLPVVAKPQAALAIQGDRLKPMTAAAATPPTAR